jgi:GTP-binding protein EngB required for normal cell division
VGEFNSGKGAFINALIGRQMLAEGLTPTTAGINILIYGPAEALLCCWSIR